MKATKLICNISFFVLLLVSCHNSTNEKSTISQNDTLTQILKQRENVLALLYRKTNVEYHKSSLKNLEIINGFRSLKLGTSFDDLFFKGWDIQYENLSDSSIIYAKTDLDIYSLDVENVTFRSATLTFFNKNLISIELCADSYNRRFYNLLCYLYGKPNIKNTFIPLIKKQEQETSDLLIDVSAYILTDKTVYVDYLKKIIQKPNIDLIWRIGNINLECREYNEFKIIELLKPDINYPYHMEKSYRLDNGICSYKISLIESTGCFFCKTILTFYIFYLEKSEQGHN